MKYYLIICVIFYIFTKNINGENTNFNLQDYLLLNSLSNKQDIQKTFNEIYKESPNIYIELFSSKWEKKENIESKFIISPLKEIEQLLKSLQIKTIFDAHCKDYSYMHKLSLPENCKYIGNDFVQNLIEENKKKYSVEFTALDLTQNIPPTVDLIFCKDLFSHISFKEIKKIIENFKKSNSKYLLVTNYQNKFNRDCVIGDSRQINLQIEPFNFPAPRQLIYDELSQKFLALWKLEDIDLNNIKETEETVTIAILAKDKAHTLPLYLKCLEKQTWPASKTYLYIRTNNNNDNSAEILREWIKKVKDRYLEIYFDDTNVSEKIQNYSPHEWNGIRFKILGKIRQDSVNWAYERFSHYFVADCDNFIIPETIETLIKSQKPIIAPLLHMTNTLYSNYHACVDKNGYLESKNCDISVKLWNQTIKDITELPLVHCTYLIRREFLPYISYDDNSWRYEYVIFSDNARKKGIPQFLDTRKVYGKITFTNDKENFEKENWLQEFQ